MGQIINFAITARKVRLVGFSLAQNPAGASLAVGQSVFGPGGITTNPPVLDRGFAQQGGLGASKIDGVVAAWTGSLLSVMVKIATPPAAGELSFLFGDYQESAAGVPFANSADVFANMLPADDLPPVSVVAGATSWKVVRNIEVGHARFVIPNLKNVGSGASGPWRLLYILHDRTG